MRLFEYLQSPFRSKTKLSKKLLLIFLMINSIVFYNAIFHDPRIGYDTTAFLINIDILSDFRLPTEEETSEYFTPPLAFILPAFFEATLEELIPAEYLNPPNEYRLPTFLYYRVFQSIPLFPISKFALALAAKFAQLLNVIYSLVLTFFFLKMGKLIYPKKIEFRILSLGLLGIIPVYYKTFAFIRPEPQLAALSVIAIYISLKIYVKREPSFSNIFLLGVVMGLIIISRQWGVFVLGAIALYGCYQLIIKTINPQMFFRTMLIGFSVAVFVGGWFYLHLYYNYGRITAFNEDPKGNFSFSLEPSSFYFGLGLEKVFSDPVYGSLRRQILPIFYSETWGDYWQFFTIRGIDHKYSAYIDGNYINTRTEQMRTVPLDERRWETNRFEINTYLGRVNVFSLFPSVIFVLGLLLGIFRLIRDLIITPHFNTNLLSFHLITLVILVSLAGYLWFLIMYTRDSPHEIKASYMLQIFPFLGLLAGKLLLEMKENSRLLYNATIVGLLLVFSHNLLVLFTNYNTLWLSYNQ